MYKQEKNGHRAILLNYLTFVICGGLPGAHVIISARKVIYGRLLGHMISARPQKVEN